MIGGNEPIIFGDGFRRRDFIHVDDVNDFHILCLTDDRTIGQTYNLGRGKSLSLFDVGAEVGTVLREKGYTIPSPIKYKQMPEINGEAFEIFADIRKAKHLGWEPKRSIAEALKDTITYLEKEIASGVIDPKTYMSKLDTDSVKIG
jgi:UDP-glucose 4-epimerase